MRLSLVIIIITVSLVASAWLITSWSTDHDRTIRVYVPPELADHAQVVEWMDRPLTVREHADGTLEYFGTTGPAHSDIGEPYGNAGVRLTNYHSPSGRQRVIWNTVPEGREMVVRLQKGDLPEISFVPQESQHD